MPRPSCLFATSPAAMLALLQAPAVLDVTAAYNLRMAAQQRALGLSTSMLIPDPLDAVIDRIADWGFGGLELWGDYPHAHPDLVRGKSLARLRRHLAGFDWITLHAPLGNASLASANPGIWRESLRQHRAAIAMAAALEARTVVVHPGDLRDSRLKEHAIARARDALAELRQVATVAGVALALENCGRHLGSIDESVNDLERLLEGLRSPYLRACLDIGHANVAGRPESLLASVADDVIHVHLHDNDGRSDEHLPMGWGTIDYGPYATVLRGAQTIVAELTWPARRFPDRTPDNMAQAALAFSTKALTPEAH